MTREFFALSFGFAVLIAATSIAQAQSPQNCADRTTVLEHLTKTYGETRQSVGLAANNAVVETFASDETGTWSIIVTMTNGQTCLVAAGVAYETIKPATKSGQRI